MMAENEKGNQAQGGLKYGSRANNINLLRFIAASVVIYFHMDILLGKSGYAIMGQGLGAIAVNVFFVLSGYLIASSWTHSSGFLSYLIRRAARIFPALIVVVLATVFVIGPLFTSLSMGEYFTSAETWEYLESILLSSTKSLPGVFEAVPYPRAVNGSLWTLRYEFAMYLLVPVAYFVIGRFGRARKGVALGLFAVLAVGYCLVSGFGIAVPDICAKGLRLASYFFAGCIVYEFDLAKHLDVQYSVLAVLFMLIFAREGSPLCVPLMLVATTVFVFGFALAPRPRFAKCFSKNDFSYGIYIWAFPVQQILVQLGGGLLRIPLWPTRSSHSRSRLPFRWARGSSSKSPAWIWASGSLSGFEGRHLALNPCCVLKGVQCQNEKLYRWLSLRSTARARC